MGPLSLVFVPEKPFETSTIKHSSLAGPFMNCKENKVYNARLERLMPNKPLQPNVMKTSSLLGPSIKYEENKVLFVQSSGWSYIKMQIKFTHSFCKLDCFSEIGKITV